MVTIWKDSTPKSRKLFNNSEQSNNATFVRYANNKIFAVGYREAKMHILDLELKTLEVVECKLGRTRVLAASENFVAIGEWYGRVIVFNHNGDRVLVSYF